MQVEILSNSSPYQLKREINKELDKLSEKGSVVLDIKFSTTEARGSKDLSVMIIYCDKAEMRDIKINNILGE